MKLTIEAKTCLAVGSFGGAAAKLSLLMEGRKNWLAHDRLRFETSRKNIDLFMAAFPSSVVQDTRQSADALRDLEVAACVPRVLPGRNFVLPPRDFQLENFERFKEQPVWAIFSEQGTGKTKVAIDIICWRWLLRMVTGVIILSSPKGVHAQWIEEQLPTHIWPSVDALSYVWDGNKLPYWLGRDTPDELQIVSGNIDMVKGRDGFNFLKAFANHHRGRLLILIDEADSIKNVKSVRSKRVRDIAAVTKQRAIMTGTPIAKDLTDEWGEFYFLDPDIIGHKYLVSFRAQYCVMGGFENRSVIAHKEVDNFKRLTAPYIFRATKAELNLPPKVYDSVVFDLSSTQRRLIRELRDQFFASLAHGPVVAVKTGATALIRIQQIGCGFAVDEDGAIHYLEDNPRLDTLVDLRRQMEGPVIIWCRFKEDIKIVQRAFSNTGVSYYGETSSGDRLKAKESFLSGNALEFIATPGSAGKGIDGLQTVCSDAIYYSNSYNAIDRWQSEDRIDRMGSIGTSRYFDIIGRGSTDRAILANLKRKKDISSLALDDLKQIMESIQ